MMNRRQMMWRKAVMCHNVSVYTAMYSVYLAIYSAVHCIHIANMVFAQCPIKTLFWLGTPWPHPSQTKQDWVYTGSYTRFDSATRKSILSNVVGVRRLPASVEFINKASMCILDGSPGPALPACKAGWVDWRKPAGWVGVSLQSW